MMNKQIAMIIKKLTMKKRFIFCFAFFTLTSMSLITDKDISGSMTTDKQTIYFSVVKPDGFGGTDIYCADKLESGEWGKARNLGKNINSKEDEINPVIDKDNATLYFDVIENGDTIKHSATLSEDGIWKDIEHIK